MGVPLAELEYLGMKSLNSKTESFHYDKGSFFIALVSRGPFP